MTTTRSYFRGPEQGHGEGRRVTMRNSLAWVVVAIGVAACTPEDPQWSTIVSARDIQDAEPATPAPCEPIIDSDGVISMSVAYSCTALGCGEGNVPFMEVVKLVDGDLDTYVSVVMDPSLTGRMLRFGVERLSNQYLQAGDQAVAFLSAPPQVDIRLEGTRTLRATRDGEVIAELGGPGSPGVQLTAGIWSEVLESPLAFNGVELQIEQQATLAPFELRVHELCVNPYADR